MSSLEEALTDRDKQINQLRDQRDRAEKDTKEEKELHERELAEYKMKIHTYESEVDKSSIAVDVLISYSQSWSYGFNIFNLMNIFKNQNPLFDFPE